MLGNYVKIGTSQGFVTQTTDLYYWLNNDHSTRFDEPPEILWQFPPALSRQIETYLPILGKPAPEQIGGILPQWVQAATIAELPKPTATEKYDGWTIGVILTDCDSKAKNAKALKQIQITGEHGTWFKDVDPAPIVIKKDYFVVGCAAIDMIKATLIHLPDVAQFEEPAKSPDLSYTNAYDEVEEIIPFDRIDRESGTQQRQGLQPYTIERYCDRYKMGEIAPPAEIRRCPNTGKNYLVDGFHRFAAQQRAIVELGKAIDIYRAIAKSSDQLVINSLRKELDDLGLLDLDYLKLVQTYDRLIVGLRCKVSIGDHLEAVWASCAVNADHGQNRTRADLYRAIDTALIHPKAKGMSNTQIAAHVCCDIRTVRVRRVMLERANRIAPQQQATVTRGGTTYTLNLRPLKRDKGANTSAHTYDDLKALYAPWGEFSRYWDASKKYQFVHPAKSIVFKSLDEAHDKFAKVTDGLTKIADLPEPDRIQLELVSPQFNPGDRVKGFDYTDGRKEIQGFVVDANDKTIALNTGQRIFANSAVLLKTYTATDKTGQAKEQIAATIAPQQFSQSDYNLVILDPPWMYQLREADETHRARTPYPNMTDQEILDLPIGTISAADSYCLLWATANHLPLAFDCLKQWGFNYKSIHTWVKTTLDGNAIKFGVGHYGRNCTEFFLIGVKGKPPSFTSLGLTDIPTVIHEAPQQHSAKPDQFYAMAHRLSNALGGSTIELFARNPQPGWDLWGAEAPSIEIETNQQTPLEVS